MSGRRTYEAPRLEELGPDDLRRHFCSSRRFEPCGVCLMQRRTLRDERLRRAGKPTLVHRPFEGLLEGVVVHRDRKPGNSSGCGVDEAATGRGDRRPGGP